MATRRARILLPMPIRGEEEEELCQGTARHRPSPIEGVARGDNEKGVTMTDTNRGILVGPIGVHRPREKGREIGRGQNGARGETGRRGLRRMSIREKGKGTEGIRRRIRGSGKKGEVQVTCWDLEVGRVTRWRQDQGQLIPTDGEILWTDMQAEEELRLGGRRSIC